MTQPTGTPEMTARRQDEAHRLAMLALQSGRYRINAEYKEATGTLTVARRIGKTVHTYTVDVEIFDQREYFGRTEYFVAQPQAPVGARHWITSVVPHGGAL